MESSLQKMAAQIIENTSQQALLQVFDRAQCHVFAQMRVMKRGSF